jgi:hypothetical protein
MQCAFATAEAGGGPLGAGSDTFFNYTLTVVLQLSKSTENFSHLSRKALGTIHSVHFAAFDGDPSLVCSFPVAFGYDVK